MQYLVCRCVHTLRFAAASIVGYLRLPVVFVAPLAVPRILGWRIEAEKCRS